MNQIECNDTKIKKRESIKTKKTHTEKERNKLRAIDCTNGLTKERYKHFFCVLYHSLASFHSSKYMYIRTACVVYTEFGKRKWPHDMIMTWIRKFDFYVIIAVVGVIISKQKHYR